MEWSQVLIHNLKLTFAIKVVQLIWVILYFYKPYFLKAIQYLKIKPY